VPKLLADRDRLQRAQVILKERARTRPLNVAELEAVAEPGFRIAVHPDTPSDEAIALLRRSLQIDGANPKYAYHLARLHFVRGEPQLAGEWLRHAACLCPTSHRIWAHVSLLQRRLDPVYREDTRYEKEALRQRGERIVEAIRQGTDNFDPALIDFVPPVSKAAKEEESRQARERPGGEAAGKPNGDAKADGQAKPTRPLPSANVRRMVDAGKCRWSGIIDLTVEQLLEGKPGESATMEKMLPLLEQVARHANQRRGGTAAFVILAVQWLVCGYPVTTVRRLSADLDPAEDSAPRRLLDLVCSLFEAEDEVGAQLAAALEQGRIPPLLTALIHRRRFLSRPLEFRLGAHQSARRILARENLKEDDANKQIKRLANLLASLYPAPPPPLKDRPSAPAAAASALDGTAAGEQLDALERAAEGLTGVSSAAFGFLKEKLDRAAKNITDQSAYAQACADLRASQALLDTLARAGREGSRWLDELIKGMASLVEADRPAEVETRKDKCNNALRDLSNPGNFKTVLTRIEKNLTAAAPRFQEQPRDPSPEVAGLIDAVAKVFPAPVADASANGPKEANTKSSRTLPNPAKRLERLTGADGLRQALEVVEEEVARVFTDARQTFAIYSNRARRLPPLAALWSLVCSHQAETLYRLDLRRQARGVWNEILYADRLDVRVLRNLAVCDTAGDVSRCLSSWRSYAEMLYLLDLVADSPRPHARVRADFHRSFGAAYAPSFLSAKLDPDWEKKLDDEATLALISFLNSPGRVRHFVNHTLLAFLNARLDFQSPPLVLGLSRGEALKMREEGRKSFVTFAEGLTQALPERAREVFPKLVAKHLDGAVKVCAAPRQLTGRADPRYEEEKTRLEHLLQEGWQLKVKLFRFTMDQQGDALVVSERARRVVRSLTSVDFLAEMARLDEVPLDTSPDFFATILRGQKPEVVRTFVQKNFNGVLMMCLLEFIFAEGDGQDEARQRQYRRLIDDWAHHAAMAEHLDMVDDPQFAYPPAAIAAISPEGGPAAPALAALKRLRDRFPELTGPARWSAHLLEKDRPAEASAVLDEAIAKGFHAPAVLLCRTQRMWLHMHVADAAIEKKDSTEAMAALDKVYDDADHLSAHGGKAELVQQGYQARMWAGLKLGNLASDAKDSAQAERGYSTACEAATYLIDNRPGAAAAQVDELAQCHFCRMLAWYRRAVLSHEGGNRTEMKRRLRQAKQDAEDVVQYNRVPDHVRSAKDLLRQIEDVIANLGEEKGQTP